MDITVYLPDEIGERAKAAELNLSRMLRDAVTEELERRTAVENTLSDSQTIELELEDDEGRIYTGRITGAEIARQDHGDWSVFLAQDGRVILYDGERMKYWVLDDPAAELAHLDPAVYAEACSALGIKAVVDL